MYNGKQTELSFGGVLSPSCMGYGRYGSDWCSDFGMYQHQTGLAAKYHPRNRSALISWEFQPPASRKALRASLIPVCGRYHISPPPSALFLSPPRDDLLSATKNDGQNIDKWMQYGWDWEGSGVEPDCRTMKVVCFCQTFAHHVTPAPACDVTVSPSHRLASPLILKLYYLTEASLPPRARLSLIVQGVSYLRQQYSVSRLFCLTSWLTLY